MSGWRLFSEKYSARSIWLRPESQWNLKNLSLDTLDTKSLTEKMLRNECKLGANQWDVASKVLRDGKGAFSYSNIDYMLDCLEDNQSETHPLANEIANELWEVFIAYRADIEALPSFQNVASLG